VCRVALGHHVRTKQAGRDAVSTDTGRRVFPISFGELDASSTRWLAFLRPCTTTRCLHPTRPHHVRYREYLVFHYTPSTCWLTSGTRATADRWSEFAPQCRMSIIRVRVGLNEPILGFRVCRVALGVGSSSREVRTHPQRWVKTCVYRRLSPVRLFTFWFCVKFKV
jgi:hypothetical protein